MTTVTEPGIYPGMPEDVYHGDPVPGGSISSTGARAILPPGCPAKFAHDRTQPRKAKRTFELGTAAHKLVLGVGPDLVPVERDRWDTNDCKAEVAAIRDRGAIPLKPAEYQAVQDMAAALRRDKLAAELFGEGGGQPEVSGFWQDANSGVWCRFRTDWLPLRKTGQRQIVADYKTCASADLDALSRAVYTHGYHVQAAWYLDGLRALGFGDAVFVFFAQEKEPPYVVTPFYLDREALRDGANRAREARRIYAECQHTGEWPGYVDDLTVLSLPPWANTEEYA